MLIALLLPCVPYLFSTVKVNRSYKYMLRTHAYTYIASSAHNTEAECVF